MNREDTRETVTPMEQRLNELYEEIEQLVRENEVLKHKAKLDTELGKTVEGMLSDDYKERFIAEYKQINYRTEKLGEMLDKYIDGKLCFEPNCNFTLLHTQYNIMCAYASILRERSIVEGIELPIG